MNKADSIKHLTSLLNDLEMQREKGLVLKQAILNKDKVLHNFQTRLDVFDETHKAIYIQEKIGLEPIKPKGLLKLAFPMYLAKKAQYEKSIAEYGKQYALAEKAYYFDYQSIRSELQITAEQEKNEATSAVEAEHLRADQAYKAVTSRINNNTIISDKYKNPKTVSVIIDYLRDGRADSLKEAINLWHDEERKRIEMEKEEEHRSEMIRLEQERLRAAQEAAEYQRMAYYAAQDAAASAKEAADEARRQRDEWYE